MTDQAEKLRNIVKEREVPMRGSSRLITVTSGKGGVGKSSTAINLAIQMKKLGYSVIIFDADFGLANVEVMLGAIPRYNLSDLISGGKKIEDILVKGPLGIQFISGGSGIAELSNLSKESIRYLVTKMMQLESMADIIIVDTGAGISDAVMEFVRASGEILLVTTPEPTSITDSYALLKALRRRTDFENQEAVIKVLANKVNTVAEGRQLFDKLNTVVDKFLGISLEFVGIVPNDANVSRAVMQQKPVSVLYEHSKAALAYETVARKLLSDAAGPMHKNIGITQVFMNIFRSKAGK